jgi:hypothetical protein
LKTLKNEAVERISSPLRFVTEIGEVRGEEKFPEKGEINEEGFVVASVSLGFRLGFEKRDSMRFCEKRELGFRREIGKDEYNLIFYFKN